jgi:hypothetical protein
VLNTSPSSVACTSKAIEEGVRRLIFAKNNSREEKIVQACWSSVTKPMT